MISDLNGSFGFWNKNVFFELGLLILTVSRNAFHSTNLFCCFSLYQAPTNNIAPLSVYKPYTTHCLVSNREGLGTSL